MRKSIPVLVSWILAAWGLGSLAGPAHAIPRYSARYEQHCNLCHVNPTGGGQRTLYAAQYLVPAEMAARKTTPEQLANIDPQIGKNITVGLDLRTIYHQANHPDPGYQDFMQMQGAVYLNWQLDERFLAYVNRGISTTPEVYGMGYVLPYHGYVKVGRFQPAYGWKFDDHKMFVRELLGFFPPAHTDVGTEVAISPQRLALTGAILNGSRGSISDNDNKPAYAAQALYRFNVAGIGAGVGGSFYRYMADGRWNTDRGPYGYLKFGPLIWCGEADWSGPMVSQSSPIEKTRWITSHELSLNVSRGVDLVGMYDFYDPDIDSKTGTRSRAGGGLQCLPYPFLGIQAMVHSYVFDQDATAEPSVKGRNYTQLEVQAHFLY